MSCSRHPDGNGPAWCQDCHGVHDLDGNPLYVPPPQPVSGFDPVKGEKLREQAIKRVDEGADEIVKAALLKIGREVVTKHYRVTTDDIRYPYEQAGNPKIREPRVLGPIMRQLQDEGLVLPLEEWEQSAWEKNHRRHLRVWQSQVCEAQGVLL